MPLEAAYPSCGQGLYPGAQATLAATEKGSAEGRSPFNAVCGVPRLGSAHTDTLRIAEHGQIMTTGVNVSAWRATNILCITHEIAQNKVV
jgi:hypothetical protein